MTKLQAFGYLTDYCNRNLGNHGVTQEAYNAAVKTIMRSTEDDFLNCYTIQDVLQKIGWKM